MELKVTKDEKFKVEEVRIRPPNLLLISDPSFDIFRPPNQINSATELGQFGHRLLQFGHRIRLGYLKKSAFSEMGFTNFETRGIFWSKSCADLVPSHHNS